MATQRKITREIKIGRESIGGGREILVQSMANVPFSDLPRLKEQVLSLEAAGCRILRFAVPDSESAEKIAAVKEWTEMPVVADIHFDYRLAVSAAERGADKIRINPGNIGGREKIKKVTDICKRKNIPIRIGVNGGSLEKHILEKYGAPTADALVESAFYHIRLLEELDFSDIVVSLKSSGVQTTIEAYRKMSELCRYPLHLGVTEAGVSARALLSPPSASARCLRTASGIPSGFPSRRTRSGKSRRATTS